MTNTRVELIDYRDNWQAAKDAAMTTIGKDAGKYPSSEWKHKILLAEHSPIRLLWFTFVVHDLPYWVQGHIVRHHIGIEHFVSTQRTDRTGEDRTQKTQDAPVTHRIVVNAQELINISRKRLCNAASPETKQTWREVINCLAMREPEIASVCVRECVYRGFCPELKPCGFCETGQFAEERLRYVKWNETAERANGMTTDSVT